jgi:hypothetical protein
MTVFRASFERSGLDERKPGIIIPRTEGSNVFSMDSPIDYQFIPSHRGLSVKHLKPKEWSKLRVPPGKAATPIFRTGRTYQVTAAKGVPRKGATIKALNPRTKKIDAILNVAVLQVRPMSIAIRPVLIRGPYDAPAIHCHAPIDMQQMVSKMNEIWTQANVTFSLVSSEPVLLDVPAEIVDINRSLDVLAANRSKGADFTMFLVAKASDINDPHPETSHAKPVPVPGVSNWDNQVSLISDERTLYPELMAHEAGHHVGDADYHDPTTGGHPRWCGPTALMHTPSAGEAEISYDEAVDHFNK